jgi:BarA-like signal transduction histidine kinase
LPKDAQGLANCQYFEEDMLVKIEKKIISCLFCLAIGLIVLPAVAQTVTVEPPVRKQQIECLRLIYKTRFDSAKLLIASFSREDEAYKSLFELFSLRWEYIPIASSKEKDNYLKKLLGFSERLSTQPDAVRQLYFHTTTELLLAEYFYNNGETLKAILHGKRAYPLMMQALDAEGNDPELLFVKGMYLYYMDFFRNRGFVYRTALFPFRDGDQKKGLALLEKSAMESSLAFTEANIYLAHIYLHLENQPVKALVYSQKLVNLYPENAKFNELLIDNLISCGKYDEAIMRLDMQMKLTYAYFKIPALYFSARVEAERKKNSAKAKMLLKECIDLSSKTKLCADVAGKAEDYLSKMK